MGHNLRILSEEQINMTLNSRSACLELRENFHDHMSDLRPVYTKEEFLAMSDHWIAARKAYDAAGQPNPEEQNISLDQRYIPGEGLHQGRVALELTGREETGQREMVHFHYNNLRIHLTEGDFLSVARVWAEAQKSFNKHYHQLINLSDPDIRIPAHVEPQFIPVLEEYIEKGVCYDADDYWDMFLEMKRGLRPKDEQRYSKGFHPTEGRTRSVPLDFDYAYLCVMYECMKKYGYGVGPFSHDYIHGEKLDDGRIHLHAAHRVACLKVLGYDRIKVVIPERWGE